MSPAGGDGSCPDTDHQTAAGDGGSGFEDDSADFEDDSADFEDDSGDLEDNTTRFEDAAPRDDTPDQQSTDADGPNDVGASGPASESAVSDGAGVRTDDDQAFGTDGVENADRQSSDVGSEDEAFDWKIFAYDVVSSALAVILVGTLLFAVSGVWPPMVAVESPSMTPHMQTGDLVFVMDEARFPGEGAQDDTGVVTARAGADPAVDYTKFEQPGDVIVYHPDGETLPTPIIHRAMFWVEKGERWYDDADRQSVGRYDDCEELPNCPAPHAGFITKGDANGRYDQVDGLSAPVKPAWVIGTAEVRIPKLGCIRLRTKGCLDGLLWSSIGNGGVRAGSTTGVATVSDGPERNASAG